MGFSSYSLFFLVQLLETVVKGGNLPASVQRDNTSMSALHKLTLAQNRKISSDGIFRNLKMLNHILG